MGLCASSPASFNWAAPGRTSTPAGVAAARAAVGAIVRKAHCAPVFSRLAWHDAGTYDKVRALRRWWIAAGAQPPPVGRRRSPLASTSLFSTSSRPLTPPQRFPTSPSPQANPAFPARGGATGSIRFKNEMAHGANAGLSAALALLAPAAATVPDVSFADLIQIAGAAAVEESGGPKLAMTYGRKDAPGALSAVKEGNLPAGGAPWPAPAVSAGDHLRRVFHRMGLTDQDIVALSGAHTLGRARPSRSGFGAEQTKYTAAGCPGAPGGSSWTPNFTTFDNSYFIETKKAAGGKGDPELLSLDTDKTLFTDPGFAPFAEKYAKDQDAFFADYAAAPVKLAELGVEWESKIPA